MSTPVITKEDRRIKRLSLALPTRIETKVNGSMGWDEITRLSDVSAFGAAFNLRRPIKCGRLICMTLPLPRQLRCYDHLEPQYRVWGLVRRCISVRNNKGSESYAIGVAFIGKYPPLSYKENPARLYDITQKDSANLWEVVEAEEKPDESEIEKDHRRHSRLQIPVGITLEIVDDDGNATASEMTVTENISLSGAAVFTTFEAEIGSFVRVKSDQYDVSIIAIVRGKRIGKDSIPRLHIEFIDRFFPLDGIE
ncbi:hypothetical protein BH10ACI1_BH10ACI1_24890 [soil metagenome]